MSNRQVRVSPAPMGCTCPPGTGFGRGGVHLTGNTACALAPPDLRPGKLWRYDVYDQASMGWGRDYVRRHDSNCRIDGSDHEHMALLALLCEVPTDLNFISVVHGAVDELKCMGDARRRAVAAC